MNSFKFKIKTIVHLSIPKRLKDGTAKIFCVKALL